MMTSSIRRAAAGFAVAALAVMGLAGCGSDPGGAEAKPLRTITHAMGTTKIFKEPRRIVALDQSFVDAALSLDADVVGYTTYRSINEGLPAYLGESLKVHGKEATSVGTLAEPSLEKIAALKPDLILSAKVRHEALYGKLAQIAPTVFSETTGAIWKDNLRLVGRSLGKEQLADQRIKEYETRAQQIGAAIKEKDGKLPEVSVVRFTDEPTVRLYTVNSYSGVVLSDVGFPRPKDQPTGEEIAVNLSEERIADVDADHIFIATSVDDKGASTKVKVRFQTNPLWGRLRGDKHEVSDLTWMTAVGLQGAGTVLDDLVEIFQVDQATTS
jgi:iron-siderophore transport system substrate-binding protein